MEGEYEAGRGTKADGGVVEGKPAMIEDRAVIEKRIEIETDFLNSTIEGYLQLYLEKVEPRVVAVLDGIFTIDQLRDIVSAIARVYGDE